MARQAMADTSSEMPVSRPKQRHSPKERGSRARTDLAISLLIAGSALGVTLGFDVFGTAAELLALSVITGGLLLVLYVRRATETGRLGGALAESRARHGQLFESATDMVCILDCEGHIVSMNEAGSRLTGYRSDEARRMDLQHLVAPASQHQAEELIAENRRGRSTSSVELELASRKGRRLPVEVGTWPLYDDNKPVGMQAIVRDIHERKRFGEELAYLASHDPLTDLFNRRRFEEELQLQIARARRYGSPGAVLFLDLDHFKDVNDMLGHWAGDRLLVDVAHTLRESVRESDILARLGGDEFTVLLPQIKDEPQIVAKRLLETLRNNSFVVAGHPFSITASAGVALIPDHGSTAEDLLAHADLAMYQAKQDGRNRVFTYSSDFDWQEQIESRLSWRRRIVEGLEKGLFVVHAQPILDLRRGRISQYELLLRLADRPGEITEAGMFIDNAERFGLIQAIDRWVVRRGIQLIAEQGRLGRRLVLEANLSGKAFADKELLPIIREELAATSADAGCLVLEVTETAAITNIREAQQFVSDLKALGCRFALDDFGVGFASFHHLKHLDVDYLKIDGSLIRDVARDRVDQHLVRAIVELARALGKETIAEFVGDEETVRVLRELGVDYAQGYHISKPADLSTFIGSTEHQAA